VLVVNNKFALLLKLTQYVRHFVVKNSTTNTKPWLQMHFQAQISHLAVTFLCNVS